MQQYLDLLTHILKTGTRKPTRGVLASTNTNVDCISVFGYQTRYDLSQKFPLVTTKKIHFKSVVHELLWFLRGDTNIKYLTENGVRIWNEWADEKGDLGPIYGKQWRSWKHYSDKHERFIVVDQIKELITNINILKNNPTSSVGRRLIVSSWNPSDIQDMKLPPCHCLYQFSLTDNKLSCQLYQRSADAFLGVPFNIASYALLVYLVAHVTDLVPGEFIHTFGDLHIYSNHLPQVEEQLSRTPYELPTIKIDKTATDITTITSNQIELINYTSHPPIKGEVAI